MAHPPQRDMRLLQQGIRPVPPQMYAMDHDPSEGFLVCLNCNRRRPPHCCCTFCFPLCTLYNFEKTDNSWFGCLFAFQIVDIISLIVSSSILGRVEAEKRSLRDGELTAVQVVSVIHSIVVLCILLVTIWLCFTYVPPLFGQRKEDEPYIAAGFQPAIVSHPIILLHGGGIVNQSYDYPGAGARRGVDGQDNQPYAQPGNPYASGQDAGGSGAHSNSNINPYARPSAAQSNPYVRPFGAQNNPYARPLAAQSSLYVRPSAAQNSPYARPSAAQNNPYARPLAAQSSNPYATGLRSSSKNPYRDMVERMTMKQRQLDQNQMAVLHDVGKRISRVSLSNAMENDIEDGTEGVDNGNEDISQSNVEYQNARSSSAVSSSREDTEDAEMGDDAPP